MKMVYAKAINLNFKINYKNGVCKGYKIIINLLKIKIKFITLRRSFLLKI